ncbi:hypothetical protein [Pseudanabaena sp. PCC 6802]|uniref:hypothetical protein n=1 Tax=Pseudanabaena sp. PCC 6802 TaxID=118173 RepID=UPI00034CA940|nr:hypothetical protein [Pseudanabaena sp. PCC 6802]
MSIEQWQTLIKEIEVKDMRILESQNNELTIQKKKKFERFEALTGVPLPDGYKEFCHVFGTGGFGKDGIRIVYADWEYSLSFRSHLGSKRRTKSRYKY